MILNDWSDANKVINELKFITYPITIVEGEWKLGSLLKYYQMYQRKRIVNYNYSYVGMTQNAARNCANWLIDNLTRPKIAVSEWKDYGWEVKQYDNYTLYAEVSCSKMEGNMWQTQVQINENTCRMGIEPPQISQFTLENTWEYDFYH